MNSARKVTIILMATILLFLFIGCSSDNGADQPGILATINNFQLTQDEFQRKLVKEIEYSNSYKATIDAKKEFLASIIKKELLIQEAARLGLDKRKDFILAIEKYWEATLIKHLMEEKNQEIHELTLVTENEIKQKYEKLKSSKKGLPPLDQIEKEIADELFEAKKTAILNDWITSLHKEAKIHINSKLLNE